MDGLIKGLIDVAIDVVGGGEADDHQRNRRDEGREEGHENEHPRSSWADIVSSNAQDQSFDQKPSPWERSEHSDGNILPGRTSLPASEQEYSADIKPTEEELNDISKACNRLWELDLNGLVPGVDYQINLGEGKNGYKQGDMASESLFSWVKDDVFKRPTYSRFSYLLNNYEPNQGRREEVTKEEIREQDAFIEEISRTAPVKYLYRLLSLKGVGFGDYEAFKRGIKSLWFDLYARAGVSGSSSAFEHVFVGEIKPGESQVSGFHNWVQFYFEESKGRVNYHGYIFPKRRGNSPDEETKLLTIQFEWNGVLKAISSTLVGVSPEFELALYTLCFYLGGVDNHVYLGPYAVNIKCYRNQGNRLGSAFPISES